MSQQYGAHRVALTAATDTTVGGVLKLQNDDGADRIVTRLVLDVTTEATGAATVDAGIDDAGDASADNLLDGVDVGTAAGVFDNIDDAGTNGQSVIAWPDGEYLVITASATLAGLEGYAYIEYLTR